MMKFTTSIITAFVAGAAAAPPFDRHATWHLPLPCGPSLPFLRPCPPKTALTDPNPTPAPTTLQTTTLAPVLLTPPSTPNPSTTAAWTGPKPFDHLASFHLPLPCGTGLPFLRPCPPRKTLTTPNPTPTAPTTPLTTTTAPPADDFTSFQPTPATTTNPTPTAPTTLFTTTTAPPAHDHHVTWHVPLPCGTNLPFLRPCPPKTPPTTTTTTTTNSLPTAQTTTSAAPPAQDHHVTWHLPLPCGTNFPFLRPCPPKTPPAAIATINSFPPPPPM